MISKVIDALNNELLNTYDKSGRLINTKDAGNFEISIEYDANGNETGRIDQKGDKWTKKYNALNLVVEESDPLGNTIRYEYDKTGRVLKKYSPKNYASINEYDGRGRLVKWKDPEGYEWVYAYDGNVNILDIEDALGGHYTMQYGSRNERTLERNQDNDTFLYQYDELKRLKSVTKPDNVTITYAYDNGGRLDQKTYSTGRTDTFAYDDNDNIISAVRAKSGSTITSSFEYDELDRMVKSTDNHSFSVRYVYDLLGRKLALVYPGYRVVTHEIDELGRLVSQTDWSGRQTQYSYDPLGRLIAKTYPNGVVQKNTIDEPGRMTGLSYELTSGSPFLAFTYAYDSNSNLIKSQTEGTADIQAPQGFDETFTHTPANKMISKQDAINPDNSFAYTYDNNGNLTAASSPLKTYNLQYDEENRTIAIQLQQGENTTNIQNIYDISGRRIARLKDGVETRFILDLTGRYEKVIAEANGSNTITKCFVYGGDVLNYRIEDPDEIASATIPNIVAMSAYQARTELLMAGFEIGTITEQWSDTVPEGDVILQEQTAGQTSGAGTAINYTISLGHPVVPNVIGMAISAAETAITDAGLSVGDVTISAETGHPSAIVLSQDPESGTEQNVGTPVNLVVSDTI